MPQADADLALARPLEPGEAIVFVATGGSDLGPNTWVEIVLLAVGVGTVMAVALLPPGNPGWGFATVALFATLAALTFLDSWNNFLWPLIAVTSTNRMTLPLGLATFQGAHSTEWTLLMAGNVMSLIPMLLIFFAAQRYFVRSVAATGLAGT